MLIYMSSISKSMIKINVFGVLPVDIVTIREKSWKKYHYKYEQWINWKLTDEKVVNIGTILFLNWWFMLNIQNILCIKYDN